MIIVLMGVTGSGKSTLGELLSEKTGWIYLDADNFHPPANIQKMSQSIPLTDEDRMPWLRALSDLISQKFEQGEDLILGCSALKKSYRSIICGSNKNVKFIFLKGSREVIAGRLIARKNHFMPPSLLDSQLKTLEEPDRDEAYTVNIDGDLEKNLESILEYIRRDQT